MLNTCQDMRAMDIPFYGDDMDRGVDAHRFVFLLLPGFSGFALQAMWEPLRQACRHAGEDASGNLLLSCDGNPVPNIEGKPVAVDRSVDGMMDFDTLVICGGDRILREIPRNLRLWLRQCRARGKRVGAVESGCVLMAELGLLDGYRCTAHWRFISALGEEYPQLKFENSLFEIDRDRFTCSGGVACLDLMLELISETKGDAIAGHCLNQFNQDRHRAGNEPQRLPGSPASFGNNRKMKRAMLIIQDHLEEELSADELADLVGSSRRQLERLFRRFLGKSPMQYRQEMRLWRARDLVMSTPMSITQVAFASGFSSNSHFSARFKSMFGISPRQARLGLSQDL